MTYIGIDLSLRSTGVCVIDNGDPHFHLIKTSDKLKDETLLRHIWNEIYSIVRQYNKPVIKIEGLSYDSISNSKDIIAGNFWFVKTHLHILNHKVQVIPVSEWRNPLFTKEERKLLTENKKLFKQYESECKGISRAEKKLLNQQNQELLNNADIKYLTFYKLPDNVKLQIESIASDKSKYDLSDAYFIASHKG